MMDGPVNEMNVTVLAVCELCVWCVSFLLLEFWCLVDFAHAHDLTISEHE